MLPRIPMGGILKCLDWHSRPCEVSPPNYLPQLCLPHSPLWGLDFGPGLNSMPKSTPAGRHCASPPSSPAKQWKPNSQHPADSRWATIMGSHDPCFAWAMTVAEEAKPSLQKGSPPLLPALVPLQLLPSRDRVTQLS